MKHANAYRIVQTLSIEKQTKLNDFVGMLDRWRSVTNLVSDSSFEGIWERHIGDALALQLAYSNQRIWLDIGSGAGFPGIVLAIALIDVERSRVHCVESDGRKCAFLRTVVQTLGLPVKVHQARIQTLSPRDIGAVEVVTARAFSSVRDLLDLARPYVADGAMLVLPRGKMAPTEVEGIDLTLYSVEMTKNAPPSDGFTVCIRNRG